MSVLLPVVGVVAAALFYLPIWMPFVVSFFFKSSDWRELKLSLRVASIVALFFVFIDPPGLRHDFGDDVAGNIAGATHNFPLVFAWTWGGGLVCALVAVAVGRILCSARRRKASRISTIASPPGEGC